MYPFNKSWFQVMMAIIWLMSAFVLGWYYHGEFYGNDHTRREAKVLKYYYKATEQLLDSLDREYSWTDAFDSDNYYESQAEVEYILNER